MTPEERAVIDAAIKLYDNPGDWYVDGRLGSAVEALKVSRTPAPVLKWYAATWGDVRADDTVRLPSHPDHPREVEWVHHDGWHVDPASSEYRPRPLKWAQVTVAFVGMEDKHLKWPVSHPVEIQLTEQEYEAIQLLGGWDNRL